MSAGRGSGSHGRKGRRVEHVEEEDNHERWAVSYADMMTVLVGLFIVLYAISQVDQAKFEQLRQSLAAGFGVSAPAVLTGSDGTLDAVADVEISPNLIQDSGISPSALPTLPPAHVPDDQLSEQDRLLRAAMIEYERLEEIATQVAQALAANSLGDRVRFRITDRGLNIGMVADDVFFSPGNAHLTDTALRVIDTVTPILVGLTEEISVEGHANTVPAGSLYDSNWELSADRATKVLRRLVEAGGMPPGRISSTGFGEARPLTDTGGMDPLEANRRVDLVVLSPVPENVRSLLPSIAAADQG